MNHSRMFQAKECQKRMKAVALKISCNVKKCWELFVKLPIVLEGQEKHIGLRRNSVWKYDKLVISQIENAKKIFRFSFKQWRPTVEFIINKKVQYISVTQVFSKTLKLEKVSKLIFNKKMRFNKSVFYRFSIPSFPLY